MVITGKVEIPKVIDIRCDICHNSCKDNNIGNLHYATLSMSGSYGSKYDCEEHTLHFCIPCYDKLIKDNDLHPTVVEGLA